MAEPNASIRCPQCGNTQRRYVGRLAELLHYTCQRCRVRVAAEVLRDPPALFGVDKPIEHPNCIATFDLTAPLVSAFRARRSAGLPGPAGPVRPSAVARTKNAPIKANFMGADILIPRCSGHDTLWQYDASRFLIFCKVCNVEYTLEDLKQRRAVADQKTGTVLEGLTSWTASDPAKDPAADAEAYELLAEASRAVDAAQRILAEGVTPVLHGSVVGYRAWAFDTGDDDWVLTGTGSKQPWPVGEIHEAVCDRGMASSLSTTNIGGRGYIGFGREDRDGSDHLAPDPDCECGFYALARFHEESRWWWGENLVRGAVKAWGDKTPQGEDRFLVQGGIGFRSQYVKIVLLAVEDDWRRPRKAAVKALAAEYGAGVCKAEHLRDAALEHGELVPDDLLAWSTSDDVWRGEGIEPSPDMVKLAEQAVATKRTVDDYMRAWQDGKLTAKQVRQLMGFPQ